MLLEHSDLGVIRGLDITPDISQYRGLIYASIPSRWQHSVISTDLGRHRPADAATKAPGDVVYDATQWGAVAPQPSGSLEFEFSLIQNRLPVDETNNCANEERCLNLTITAPVRSKDLPVMVL
jgi:carboxylesterase type B